MVAYMPSISAAEVPTNPTDGLASVVALRRLAERLEAAAVEQAMRAGWTWAEAAEALGVTRQAVHKKHAKRLIAAGVELRRRES
jgi:transcriptional regulator with GAF, ATPase, and Fis domain